MARRLRLLAILPLVLLLSGCSPVEKQAYNTIVGAKAFLDSMKAQHPECNPPNPNQAAISSSLCTALTRATGAKDALITAVEVYCAGPQFEAGGPCNAPTKSSPGAQQAVAKLQAAISNYESIEKDVKKAVGK